MSLKPEVIAVGLGAVVLIYLAKRAADGVGNAVSSGARAVDGAITGTVGTIGAAFGLPTPGETIDDPARVRYLIDTLGWFEASKWATAPALFKAMNMAPGSGTPGGSYGATSTVPSVYEAGSGGWTFNDSATRGAAGADPFDPRNYQARQGQGSIYDAGFGLNGWGQQMSPIYVGGLGSVANI